MGETTKYYAQITGAKNNLFYKWHVAVGTKEPNTLDRDYPRTYGIKQGLAITAAGARRKAARWIKQLRKNELYSVFEFDSDDDQLTADYERVKRELSRRGLKI